MSDIEEGNQSSRHNGNSYHSMPNVEEGNESSRHSDDRSYHSAITMSYIEEGNQSSRHSAQKEIYKLELYKAALSNDWVTAQFIYENTEIGYGDTITSRGETGLHVAALAGHAEFVKKIVDKMTVDQIKKKTKVKDKETGNTAIHCVAISGNVKAAKAILMKDKELLDLALVRGIENKLPIFLAAAKGNKAMVRFLYNVVKDQLKEEIRDNYVEHKALFMTLIKSNMYDIALQVVEGLSQDEYIEEALYVLAQIPLIPPCLFNTWIHPWLQKHDVEEYTSAVQLIKHLWESLLLQPDETRVSALVVSPDPSPVIEAAKQGNYVFLCILIATFPDILFSFDSNKYTPIHHAILNRHVEIFNFIHIGPAQIVATFMIDKEGNNLLHLAAKLPPSNRLNVVPGAALQLQRELLWFEEVKKVMEPHEVNRKKFSKADIPLEKMSSLFQEMKQQFSNAQEADGLFQKLEAELPKENCELDDYHPIFKEINQVMTQSDIILLFKKLKRVMDEEKQQLEQFTKFWELLVSLKGIIKAMKQQLQPANSKADLLFLLRDRVKQNYHSPLRTQYKEIENLRTVISRVISRYEKKPCDSEAIEDNIYEELATQMKMIIQWQKHCKHKKVVDLFQEMKKLMERHENNEKNNLIEEYTPHDVFVKEHKELMVQGEKWMRETANSCMIVAVLITTIAFAAAITVPGGNSDNGFPNFYTEILFKAFAIADSISMISSATSLLSFLSILTARYTMDDFRWSLPNQLFISLLTLFVSIVSMMVAFVLSIFITFKNSPLMLSVSIAAASSLPIVLFIWQHSTLFFDVFLSTYASYLLFKPGKHPSLLFKRRHTISFSQLLQACGWFKKKNASPRFSVGVNPLVDC